MSILICPHCKCSLSDSGNKSFSCENNHSFDVAKQGYLNLLPVHQKKSKNPGDNQMMIRARRSFLELGFYDPLIEDIKININEKLEFNKDEIFAFDAGCGEGYYSEKALNCLDELNPIVYGTDISKIAVKDAAKTYKGNFYFVSSVYNLPIASHRVDLVLSVFSPVSADEFMRILSSQGAVVVVSPAPNHLKEIAELIYKEFKPHTTDVVDKLGEHFIHESRSRTTFGIDLKSSDDILSLLKMTPYYWSTGLERLQEIMNETELSVKCDFNIDIFKPIK